MIVTTAVSLVLGLAWQENLVSSTGAAESSHRPWVIGDNGRSRGEYQIQRWIWYAFGGRRPWEKWAHVESEARPVAGRIVWACQERLRKKGKPVTWAGIRHLYTHGGF